MKIGNLKTKLNAVKTDTYMRLNNSLCVETEYKLYTDTYPVSYHIIENVQMSYNNSALRFIKYEN